MPAIWLLLTLATAAEPGDAAGELAANAGVVRAGDAAADTDRRDLLLFMESGPLHLRLHLKIGGVSLAGFRKTYIDRLLKSLDGDGDGRLTRAEASRSPLLRTKSRPSANAFLQGLQEQALLTRREVEQKVNAKGHELLSFQEIPAAKIDLEVFALLDQDGSSTLETAELVAASDLILLKDTDGDQCVSFEEFFPPPPPPNPNQPVVVRTGQSTTRLTSPAQVIGDAGNGLYLERLRDKYDRDRDGQLSESELGWSADRIKELDRNGNGKLDGAELGAIGQMTPEAELSIDLKGGETGGGVIRLEGTTGKRLGDAGRADLAKVAFQPAVITFSQRNLDPISAALDDAMRKFNSLDADANGYLTRDETTGRQRFERELFELLDADGDEKVFAEEMKEYVVALCEPVAGTCRINVYDTGNGFFMALDANADGRVSEREKRQAATALAQLEQNGSPGIQKDEPAKHFLIEFSRGAYQLFGASEQPTAQTPAFRRRQLSGPIWFQRMDRNNDGDLIWNEFLGPRWVFDQLDADSDELLDSREAGTWRPKP